MPLYEFVCKDCNKKFEKLCSFNAAGAGVVCPGCESINTTKAVSGFASFSKGEGGTTAVGGGGHSCGGCSSHNCGTCH